MARRRRVARMRSPAPSAGSAARYHRSLVRHVVRPIRAMARAELDDVLREELAANAERMRRDQMSDRVRAALLSFADRLRRFVGDDEAVGKSVGAVGAEVDRRHKGEFYGALERAVGVNVLASEPFRGAVMDQWVRANTGLIRSLSQSTVRGISREIDAAFEGGLRHEELAMRWRERGLPVEFGTLEGRTRVIARDQVNKLNGQLTQARQENLGVTHYVWRTSGDERVRDRHVELDGQRFAWDSPPPDGHPGNPVQCRCVAEAVLDLDSIGQRAEAFALQRQATQDFGRAAARRQ